MELLDPKKMQTFESLVKNHILLFQGGNGEKEQVKAFTQVIDGTCRLNFKYGKRFYNFIVAEATEFQKDYNARHNLK